MRRRQAKKIFRRWLRGTPFDEHGRALPPYHSVMKYRRATFRRAATIVGNEELRHFREPPAGRARWFKWEPYEDRKPPRKERRPVCCCDGWCAGRTYECNVCFRDVPWCFGCNDDMPAACDDCWGEAHAAEQVA